MGLILRQNGPSPEEQLLDFMREKKLLVILDSFEGLVQWSAILAHIHAQAPGIKILVTSRHRLLLQGEWVMEVNGLDYPPEQHETPDAEKIEDVQAYNAVDLFLHAAGRDLVNFDVGPDELIAINQITRLLGGHAIRHGTGGDLGQNAFLPGNCH